MTFVLKTYIDVVSMYHVVNVYLFTKNETLSFSGPHILIVFFVSWDKFWWKMFLLMQNNAQILLILYLPNCTNFSRVNKSWDVTYNLW